MIAYGRIPFENKLIDPCCHYFLRNSSKTFFEKFLLENLDKPSKKHLHHLNDDRGIFYIDINIDEKWQLGDRFLNLRNQIKTNHEPLFYNQYSFASNQE